MKTYSIFKLVPFLSVLIIILFLSFTNRNQNTKLNILIWQTPTLSLGTYLVISSCSGFFLSYILTYYIANSTQPKLNKRIKYTNDGNLDEQDKKVETNNVNNYNTTLFERDLKDPSPTIDANFRVIGRINKKAKNISYPDSEDFYDNSISISEEYSEDQKRNKGANLDELTSNDWNDYSYADW